MAEIRAVLYGLRGLLRSDVMKFDIGTSMTISYWMTVKGDQFRFFSRGEQYKTPHRVKFTFRYNGNSLDINGEDVLIFELDLQELLNAK